ncbi:MAG: IPTL-CTERM sorting domain-containing protein, partial [Acidobacteriota bacterium]
FTVPFATSDGTATVADGDYTAAGGTLTFTGADGEVQTVDVTVNGDATVEAEEAFSLSLGPASNPDVAAGVTATGTLENDDAAQVSIADVGQAEGDGAATFSFAVTLTGDVAGGFTVPFATQDGTATVADGDYATAAGTLTFTGADGEVQTVDVTVNGDATVEADETFRVVLDVASNADVAVVDGDATGTIANDDSAELTLDEVSRAETDGATVFTFTVSLSGDVAGGFTVLFSTEDGTAAVADGDYDAASGVLTFSGTDGETQSLDVTVNGDVVVEPDETFQVRLGAPSSADVTVAPGGGLGTVENDDAGALLTASLRVARYAPPFDTVLYEIEITNLGGADQPDDPTSDELENGLPDTLRVFDAGADRPDFAITVDSGANAITGNGPLPAGETVIVWLEAVVDADAGELIANQALVRFDSNNDGTNDTVAPSDDPASSGTEDATVFTVVGFADIPTLSHLGLALMALLIAAAGVGLRRH